MSRWACCLDRALAWTNQNFIAEKVEERGGAPRGAPLVHSRPLLRAVTQSRAKAEWRQHPAAACSRHSSHRKRARRDHSVQPCTSLASPSRASSATRIARSPRSFARTTMSSVGCCRRAGAERPFRLRTASHRTQLIYRHPPSRAQSEQTGLENPTSSPVRAAHLWAAAPSLSHGWARRPPKSTVVPPL